MMMMMIVRRRRRRSGIGGPEIAQVTMIGGGGVARRWRQREVTRVMRRQLNVGVRRRHRIAGKRLQ
jgi:hypothetical protein